MEFLLQIRKEKTLVEFGGDRDKAAGRLGMPRATFYRRAKEMGLLKRIKGNRFLLSRILIHTICSISNCSNEMIRNISNVRKILEKRHAVYEQSKAVNSNRWSRGTRNWSKISVVELNPRKKDEKLAA